MNTQSKVRSALLFFIFCTLFGTILVHLFGLQIRQHSFFSELGNRQYFMTLTSYPERALICDRNGFPLALNKESTSAFAMPHQVKDWKRLMTFLKKEFPQAIERVEGKKDAYFVYIKRKLTEQEEALIKAENNPDIHFVKEPSRFYPLEAAATITGITNIDNQGLLGIELWYNDQLAGKPTTSILEKDARSGMFYFAKTTAEEGTEGVPVTLTIDRDIQFLVQEELNATMEKFGAKQGAAIVMDPDTGEILALTTYPTFDPNNSTHLDPTITKNLAITESFEFGSAFKSFFALAALEEGVVKPDELIDCEYRMTTYVEGRKVNTTESSVAGVITFSQVIQKSNNIGVAKIAKKLGPEKLYRHYKALGFGTKTGIPFPGEQSGFLMPPDRWSAQTVISLSYGYEVTTTLLRLATVFSLFCNDGHVVTPKLIMDTTPPELGPKLYSTETIQENRAILEETARTGSARKAHVEGYTTIGKTSTANLLENGVYNNNKNLYGFVGAVEKGSYKRVICCFIKESPRHNLYASTVAAPLFERIAEKIIVHDSVW